VHGSYSIALTPQEQSQQVGILPSPSYPPRVASDRERARCREQIERLSESRGDCEAIHREAIVELQRVIGFDRWCWVLADPDTLVPLAGIAEHDYGPGVPRVLELEYSGDFTAMDAVAQRPEPVGSLAADTGGDLPRSSRWDEVLRRVGIGDEAVVACRDAFGCWGWIKAYRDGGDRWFEDADLDLLASASSSLAAIVRRRVTDQHTTSVLEQQSAGVIVLDSDLRPLSRTAGAQAWIDALPGAALFASWGMLPAEVYPLAALARSRDASAGVHAVDRTVDGRWVMIEAEPLEGHGDGQIVVTFHGAAPRETFDLLCRAYKVTRRERDVVGAVLAGLDTRRVSEHLFISPHTVQDHLKSVFGKVGVRSRRELLATFNASQN
jgi:DNA-binding CsgD family transcriptional regulator